MSAVRVLPSTPTSPIALLAEDYLINCEARGLSPRTIHMSYGYSLRSVFLPWCAEEQILSVEALDSRAVDRFTTNLLRRTSARGRPLSKDSVHSYVRAVRQFLTWAEREGEKVAAKPQLPKRAKHRRDVLTRDDIDRMEAAVPAERDKLIVRLLADCGLRAGELVRLRIGDIVRPENHGQFDVRGKGDRQRRVPVPPRLLRRLDRHVASRSLDLVGEVKAEPLFVGLRRGLSGDYEPLTESGLFQLVRAAAQRAKLRQAVGPHLLRHSWMTEMLRQGVNPIQLSVIAGASLKVIEECYQHLTEDDAYDSMLRALTAADQRR